MTARSRGGRARAKELPATLRQGGMVMILVYCLFNITNVLHLQSPVSWIGLWLSGMAGLYLLQRFVILHTRGLVLSRAELYAIVLFTIIFISLVAQSAFLSTYVASDGVDTLAYIRTAATLALVWALIGGAASMFDMPDSPILGLATAGVVLALFLPSLGESGSVAYGDIKNELDFGGVNHLLLEQFVIIALAFAYSTSERSRMIVALVGIVVLFLMSGRTSFAAFILTVLIMNLRGRVLRNLIVFSIMLIVVGFGARLVVESGFVDVGSKAVREMLFLGGIEDDNSFIGRRELLIQGMQDLPGQFLFGDFTLTSERSDGIQGYIHNLLSGWQMYGFFSFAAIAGGLLYCVRIARRAVRERPGASTRFGLFLLIYTVIGVVVAKSVLWNLLWFTLGYWLLRTRPVEAQRRRRQRRSSSDLPRPGGSVKALLP